MLWAFAATTQSLSSACSAMSPAAQPYQDLMLFAQQLKALKLTAFRWAILLPTVQTIFRRCNLRPCPVCIVPYCSPTAV